jgi:hypothetical protein
VVREGRDAGVEEGVKARRSIRQAPIPTRKSEPRSSTSWTGEAMPSSDGYGPLLKSFMKMKWVCSANLKLLVVFS